MILSRLAAWCLFASLLASIVIADSNLVRCGGFVQASSSLAQRGRNIDVSSVLVQAVSRSGAVKETTECAPNGYYILPIYENGDYEIRVTSPSGWSFEKQSIPVKIEEGKECNGGDQINFVITGFALSGVVNSPSCSSSDMRSATIHLYKDEQEINTVNPSSDGHYEFENLLPGPYSIRASHPSWSFSVQQVNAQVNWGKAEVEQAVEVSGYQISGSVSSSEGLPMEGAQVEIFSGSSSQAQVRSDDQGQFRFQNVACGEYRIVPSFNRAGTSFDLAPKQLPLTVRGESQALSESFRVVGFSISGQVHDLQGAGIADVSIVLNGKDYAVTDAQGHFTLEKMSSGNYDIAFRKAGYTFPSLSQTHITPTIASLPPVTLEGVDICGHVRIERQFKAFSQSPRSVSLRTSDESSTLRTVQVNAQTSAYCFERVAPGAYVVEPQVTEKEADALLFEPKQRQVTVENAPIYHLDFAQSKSVVRGRVQCVGSCDSVKVSVFDVEAGHENDEIMFTSPTPDGSFELTGIFPGRYRIQATNAEWCWDRDQETVQVNEEDIEGIQFRQSGFAVEVQSSHAAQLHYTRVGDNKKEQHTAALNVGDNKFCVPVAGRYQLVPESCFRFDKKQYEWDSSAPQLVSMTVTHYPVRGTIRAPADTEARSVSVTVTSSQDTGAGSEINLSPTSQAGEFEYLYWSSADEQVAITPTSRGNLLFYPTSRQVLVEESPSCPSPVEVFEARPGMFIEGVIEPERIAGVEITVRHQDTQQVALKTHSDSQGRFRAGPLYDHIEYVSSAHLDGYHFTSSPNGFKAIELSQITLDIVDEEGESIQGVLLSITGDAAFHGDGVTNEEGRKVFEELFPGQYYLRPILKEYTFEPTQITVNLGEGTNEKVRVTASRVAYSIFGSVHSLNGDAERGVIVYARRDDGEQTEESQSDAQGRFRIRGLLPSRNYQVSVRGTERIDRATPSQVEIKMEKSDQRDLNFIVFRTGSKFDISGVVEVPDEFQDSVQVELYTYNRKSDQEELVQSVPLRFFKTFDFPQLSKDRYTLKLTSSLSTAQYDYELPVEEIDIPSLVQAGQRQHRFHHTLSFSPKSHYVPPEVANVSFWPLILLTVGFFGFWYRETLQELYQQRMDKSPKSQLSGFEFDGAQPKGKGKAKAKASKSKGRK